MFFNCPESVMSSDLVYWCTLYEWIGCPSALLLIDMPAVDCDALITLRNESEKSQNER